MQEAFLHYVWQYQYFLMEELQTTEGQVLSIKSTGFINSDAGPDFNQSKVLIDDIEWSGSVEIHLKSSDWYLHHHQEDKAYNNVILHVVWEYDKVVTRSDKTQIPTLELKNRVRKDLLEKYNDLINFPRELIPCQHSFKKVDDITKYSMMDKLALQRLSFKANGILERLKRNKGNWEETAYQSLFKSIGLKVNGDTFEQLAERVPFSLIKKYYNQRNDIESILFGMAGFLEKKLVDPYYEQLQQKFQFLAHKHQVIEKLDAAQWKFMRLRPANFPTVRISQLSTILSDCEYLFNKIIKIENVADIQSWIQRPPSEYWQQHYNFCSPSPKKLGGLGQATLETILINSIVPILVAYGKEVDDQSYVDRAISYLETVKPENNKITRVYKSLGLSAKTGLDSQAMIQWYNEYCQKKKCLNCAVGTAILKG